MSLEQLATKLTTSFQKEDYSACYKLLTPIKIELIEHNLLVPGINSSLNPNDLLITRSILEIGALVSINLLKMNDFSNYIILLKPFYENKNFDNKSDQMNKLLSLYLLLLLTQYDLSLFYIELENFQNFDLNVDDLENDEYFSIPIKFQKWIIDGDFNKIFEILSNSNQKFPCNEFKIFEPELFSSIRNNISINLQQVYNSLPVENLKLLLFLNELSEVNQYVEEFNWNLKNGIVYFEKNSKSSFLDDVVDEIQDEKSIIKNSLIYASEMEKII